MLNSPIIVKNSAGKRPLFVSDDEEEEAIDNIKKPKMSTYVPIENLNDLFNRLQASQAAETARIQESQVTETAKVEAKVEASENNITNQVRNMQQDITTIKSKQDLQEAEVRKLNINHDNMFSVQNMMTARLEKLEKEGRPRAENKTGPNAYHERLREQVAKTCNKIAIYDLPEDKDTSFIRKQADNMKIPQEVKDEMRNNMIEFIPDKRTYKKDKAGKLHHMTTSGIQARQTILHAAKNKPGNMRWDVVVPKDFRIGYNKQKSCVWQLRNGLNMSCQQEIHGHTSFVYINEKKSTDRRRVFSEFTPVEKPQRQKRNQDSMETNVDVNNDDEKPIIIYSENKKTADDLASIIFWTGICKHDSNDKKMDDLTKVISTEDFTKIDRYRTIHTEFQSRLFFYNKEDAAYIYNKYRLNADLKAKNWDWSIFKLDDFKLE